MAATHCELCGNPISSPRANRFCSASCRSSVLNRKPEEECLFGRDRCLKTETCWLWLGSINKKGYGTITFRRHGTLAHRAAYIYTYGPVPEGLEVDHKCNVRRCVRPDHLQAIPHIDNVKKAPRNLSEAFGEQKSLFDWTKDDRCVVNYSLLGKRIRQGWDLEAALTTPRPPDQKQPKPISITAWGETKSPTKWIADPRCKVTIDTIYSRIRHAPTMSPEHMLGIPARRFYQMVATHCRNGHELSGDNRRMDGNHLRCATCRRISANQRYHRKVDAIRDSQPARP